jgi:hypothetical protein
MLRIAAINKVKFARRNALRARKKTEVPIIVRRHVAAMQRNNLPSLPFRKNGPAHNRYNRYNRPSLTPATATARRCG